MFCIKCGQILPKDAVFCLKCGTKVMQSAGDKLKPSRENMRFVDQIKEVEKRTVNNKMNRYKYGGFISGHFTTAIRCACAGNAKHSVAGFYFMESGYDNDTYGFKNDPRDKSTHISNMNRLCDLENVNTSEMELEIRDKLIKMGFRVNKVSVSRHTKDESVENGYGILGLVKKYRTVSVEYIQVYIDIAW